MKVAKGIAEYMKSRKEKKISPEESIRRKKFEKDFGEEVDWIEEDNNNYRYKKRKKQ